MSRQHLLRTKIRFFRISRGLTQCEISSKLGLSLRTYQRIENGSSPLDVQTLMAIADIFNLSFYEMSNPEVKLDELGDVEFFKDKASLFEHANLQPEVSSQIRTLVKRTKQGEIPLEKIETLEEFKAVPVPLFFSDLKKTATNSAFQKISQNTSGDNFHTTIQHWKASEYCLKSPYIGFNFSHNYTVVLSPSDIQMQVETPVLFGFQAGIQL